MKNSNIDKYDWEVPEIDLELRHYSGHPSDIIKRIKTNIENYLQNPNVPDQTRSIYSAIYHAFNYYKSISYLPSPEYGTEPTFLSNALKTFNDDYKFLTNNFHNQNSSEYEKPVIALCGRIKSLYSFNEKVKEKINDYINEGRDFQYFNESIRDLIGVRIIINPPNDLKAKGQQAQSDYLYYVYSQLMMHHGILSSSPIQSNNIFEFLPINSRYDKSKTQKIRERVTKEGFDAELYDRNGNLKIFIPKIIPDYMELPQISSVCKDYNRYPKSMGYQSLHTCVVPSYSKDVKIPNIPSYIIPSKSYDYSFEYQLRLAGQDYWAEHGLAAHTNYKPDGDYHRLLVPTYITNDIYLKHHHPEVLNENINGTTDNIENLEIHSDEEQIHVRNFGESFTLYSGTSFKTYFGCPFRVFRDSIISSERNDILSGKKIIFYDPTAEKYRTKQKEEQPVVLAPDDIRKLKQTLQSQHIDLIDLFEESGLHKLADGILEILSEENTKNNGKSTKTIIHKPQKPIIYTFESSEDRRNQKQNKDTKNTVQKHKDTISQSSNTPSAENIKPDDSSSNKQSQSNNSSIFPEFDD